MGNLEHNIKEAFAGQDTNTKLENKADMWNRLDSTMGRRKGVAALWRVAAILLGVFFLTGAFAALNYRAKQQIKLEKIEMENTSLQITIDSLFSLPLATKTEIKIVEKEKLVYRDRPIVQQKADSEKYWEKRYEELADSTELLLANNIKQAREIEQLNEVLAQTKQEFTHREQDLKKKTENENTAPFELKSERVEVGISKTPVAKNPDLKMKVFEKNFIENRNNLNSTIFKK